MTCKACNQKMRCIDSRPHHRGTYRRHWCESCLGRASTIEVPMHWFEQAQAALDKLREIRVMVHDHK